MSKKDQKKELKEDVDGQKQDFTIDDVSNQVIEKIKPQLKEFGDSLKDMIHNEISAIRQEIETKVGSPKVASPEGDMMGMVSGIMKQIGLDPKMLQGGGQPQPQDGQNPLGGLMGGGGLGQIDVLMKLLQMVGIGGQQQNPMQNVMMEMMYKNFLAQQYRQSVLMDSIVTNFVKNPDKLKEFTDTQQVLVKDPVEMVAKALGQQGNINPNTK